MKSQGEKINKKDNKKIKVFVGVSGGVDSSVALALLKEQGYNVTGVFLKVWHPEWLPCDWREERRSAMRVCATLGVPFLTLDCQAEYKKEVVDYMIAEYSAGRTPNPDVFCNKYVKFGVFLEKALALGADFIATGHYARLKKGYDFSLEKHFSGYAVRPAGRPLNLGSSRACEAPEKCFSREKSGIFELQEATDDNKDQSYFLYTLNQEQLSRTLFPVGNLTKPEVRKLAEKFGLSTATKKDSQGVCFLENIDIKEFLSHYIETKRGDVLNTTSEIIGWHNGAILYTIGERHGFTITKKTPNESRLFVVAKNLEKNTITVANKEKESDVVFSTKEIIVKNLHFILDRLSSQEQLFSGASERDGARLSGRPAGRTVYPENNCSCDKTFNCTVRIRYRQEKQNCSVIKKSDGWHITFAEPQNGVAIGQSAVLYDNDICLGGGIIEKVL